MSRYGYKDDLLILPIVGQQVIYDAYKQALMAGVPAKNAVILIDEQSCAPIAEDARKQGYAIALSVEKTAQEEFQFEYGDESGALVKALVRYNPEGDAALNRRQLERLKRLGDHLQGTGIKYMLELLNPPTQDQMARCGGSQATFDLDLRPQLMLTAMKEIQGAGVEPDVWKLDGVETAGDCRKVSELARSSAHRGDVGIIVLGRGESVEKVKAWLTVAAQVPGLIGFTMGRGMLWAPITALNDGIITRAEAVHRIATTYGDLCNHWLAAKAR